MRLDPLRTRQGITDEVIEFEGFEDCPRQAQERTTLAATAFSSGICQLAAENSVQRGYGGI